MLFEKMALPAQVVDALLGFIAANPAKSEEWKAQADAKLASSDERA